MKSLCTTLTCGALMLSVTGGCVSAHKGSRTSGPAASAGGIEEINLLAIPVGVNLDDVPGLDGFVIKIYASAPKRPKTVAIEDGTIDVLMFDGISGLSTAEPRATWSYSAQELERFEIQTSIGTGYQLAPLWGDRKPAESKIAVVVRYTPSEGTAIVSAPSIISVALR